MAAFDRSETLTKVIDIVAQKLKIDKATIQGNSTLQDLGADSLDMVEIVMKLEEVFGIEIKDEDAENLTNVNEVVDYVQNLRTK